MAAVEVKLREPDVPADFRALPSQDLRVRALFLLASLKGWPDRGLRLSDHPASGDLSDCRKLYFDVDENVTPGYRIVYRLSLTTVIRRRWT